MTTMEQIPIIRKVTEETKWYLGEELHCDPGPDHPLLRERVALWVLAHGAELRQAPSPLSLSSRETARHSDS